MTSRIHLYKEWDEEQLREIHRKKIYKRIEEELVTMTHMKI